MATLASPLTLPFSPIDSARSVELRCYTYGHRLLVLDGVLQAMKQASCCLQSRRALSSTSLEMCFVTMLGAVDDLYCGIIAAGVEMPRESHLSMTWLCNQRRQRRDAAFALRTVSIRLEMHFMDEPQEEMGFVSAGMA